MIKPEIFNLGRNKKIGVTFREIPSGFESIAYEYKGKKKGAYVSELSTTHQNLPQLRQYVQKRGKNIVKAEKKWKAFGEASYLGLGGKRTGYE